MAADLHWTAFLTALSTPLLALIAAGIAYRQAKVARSKLNLDLFEKRFKMFDAARKLIGSVVSRGNVTQEELGDFMRETLGAKWIFSDSFGDYLTEMRDKAIDLQTLCSELDVVVTSQTPAEEAERKKLLANRRVVKNWFYHQFTVLENKATPFMQIETSLAQRVWNAIPVAESPKDL
jgi:hypothetical protein